MDDPARSPSRVLSRETNSLCATGQLETSEKSGVRGVRHIRFRDLDSSAARLAWNGKRFAHVDIGRLPQWERGTKVSDGSAVPGRRRRDEHQKVADECEGKSSATLEERPQRPEMDDQGKKRAPVTRGPRKL